MNMEQKTEFVKNKLRSTDIKLVRIEVATNITSRTMQNIINEHVSTPHADTINALYQFFKKKGSTNVATKRNK